MSSSSTPAQGSPGPAGLEPSSTPALHPDRSQAQLLLTLIGLGAAIGIPAALVASAFLAAVHGLEHWLWTDVPESMGLSSPPWYFVVFLPVVGAGIVALARALLPGDGGHSPLQGIGGPPTPVRYGLGVALAAVGTLSFGAVLGPEAPLIALGSVVGMAVTPLVKVGDKGKQVLATAGSFSAVSALFGGPLVAGILLLEAGLAAGTALIPALLPGLAAAAIGYVLFTGLGDWGGLSETVLKVPGLPAYDGTRVVDLLLAIVVGVVLSLLMGRVKGLAHSMDRAASVSSGRKYGVLLLGGLLVGLVAQGASLFGADSQDVLFSGQASIPALLAESSVGALAVLLVAKALGYGISLGAGFRGGPVFPAIFVGVTVCMFPSIWFDCSTTWAVVVGTAAGMTAGTGMVFSALLFGMLMAGTGGQDALPAAVLAVIAAWVTNAAQTRRAAAAAAPDPRRLMPRTSAADAEVWQTHPVTPDRFDDFADVINPNRRATHCWCLSHRIGQREIEALGRGSREQAMRTLCARPDPPGVLTYRDGVPVGWCSISPRADIPRLAGSKLIRALDDVAVWSIICVVVRGGHRRRGVTGHLIEGAVAYAASRGAPAVEAYPVDPDGRMDLTMAFVGTRSMFAHAGFEVVGVTDAVASKMPRLVMRRTLV